MYQIISDSVIKRVADGTFIPVEPMNRDYLEYLAWLDAGNVPEDVRE